MNVPQILYKYLPPYFGANNEDILPILDNHLIRYSQLSAMNDKREGTRGLLVLDIDKHLEATRIKSLQILGLNWIYDNDPDKYNKIIFIQRFGMQEEMKRNQYRNDPISFSNEIITEILKTLDEKNGFLSLSDNWKSETMWSHYTLTNTGVCIGFKTSSMLLRGHRGGFQGVRKLKKVSYSDDRVVIDLEKDKDYDLYFHKTLQWSYEQEWRSACRFDLLQRDRYERFHENIYLLRFQPRDIAEIYVGTDASDAVKTKVRAFGNLHNIPVWQVLTSDTVGMDRIRLP